MTPFDRTYAGLEQAYAQGNKDAAGLFCASALRHVAEDISDVTDQRLELISQYSQALTLSNDLIGNEVLSSTGHLIAGILAAKGHASEEIDDNSSTFSDYDDYDEPVYFGEDGYLYIYHEENVETANFEEDTSMHSIESDEVVELSTQTTDNESDIPETELGNTLVTAYMDALAGSLDKARNVYERFASRPLSDDNLFYYKLLEGKLNSL